MCVIIAVKEGQNCPPLKMLQDAQKNNPDGAGVAWVDREFVKWKKNLKAEKLYEIGQEIPSPFLIHFRLASIGGKSPHLCHPFPVSKTVPLDLGGAIRGRVLVHNGHWSDWKKVCLDTLVKRGGHFPEGKFSDTRAIAWLVNIYGTGVLNLIDEKVAVLSSTAGLKTFGGGWQEHEEYLVSNTHSWVANYTYKWANKSPYGSMAEF